MPRAVLVLSADLLFGSQLQGALGAAGHEVRLLASPQELREALGGASVGEADAPVVLVDLTDERLDGSAVVKGLAADGLLDGVATVGYYSHVDVAARERAQEAGFTLVVPRSRMAREAAELVARAGLV